MSDAASMLAPAPAPAEGAAPAPAEGAAPAPPAEAPAPAGIDWAAVAKDRGWTTAEDIDANAPKVPDTPDAYELPVPDGEDPAFAKAIAPLFHAAGLTAEQATKLAAGWNTMQEAQREAAKAAEAKAALDLDARNQREQSALKTEWGEAFTANSEHGRRAFARSAEAMGVAPEVMADMVKVIEDKAGFAATVKLFSFWGRHFAEDTAHGLGDRPGSPSGINAQSLYDKSNMNP